MPLCSPNAFVSSKHSKAESQWTRNSLRMFCSWECMIGCLRIPKQYCFLPQRNISASLLWDDALRCFVILSVISLENSSSCLVGKRITQNVVCYKGFELDHLPRSISWAAASHLLRLYKGLSSYLRRYIEWFKSRLVFLTVIQQPNDDRIGLCVLPFLAIVALLISHGQYVNDRKASCSTLRNHMFTFVTRTWRIALCLSLRHCLCEQRHKIFVHSFETEPNPKFNRTSPHSRKSLWTRDE